MGKDDVKTEYKTVSVAETVRGAIVNEKGEEVTTQELLVSIANDIAELKRKLVG